MGAVWLSTRCRRCPQHLRLAARRRCATTALAPLQPTLRRRLEPRRRQGIPPVELCHHLVQLPNGTSGRPNSIRILGYAMLGGMNDSEAIESLAEPGPQSSLGCARVFKDDPQPFPTFTAQLVFFARQPHLPDRPELVRMDFAHRSCPFGVHPEQRIGYAVPTSLSKRSS